MVCCYHHDSYEIFFLHQQKLFFFSTLKICLSLTEKKNEKINQEPSF